MEASRSEIRRKMMMIGIFRMSIEQGWSVVNQVLTAYAANPTLHNMEMKVKFVSERGYNCGLRRELVGCFWESVWREAMRKVPVLTPLQNVNYSQVGRFVSHSYYYMLTGFFPICFSRVFAKVLTCGEGRMYY